MPDIGTILMVVFWIFIVRSITRFIKKAKETAEKQGTSTSQKPVTTQKQPQNFQDIFREMQKKMQEAEAKQNIPPYAGKVETISTVKEVKDVVKPPVTADKRSTVHRQKTILTEQERKANADKKALQDELLREKSDAAEAARIKKIYAIDAVDEESAPFELDLRNAIIGQIILERPYS